MKRLLWIGVGVVAAVGIWYAVRLAQHATSSSIAALLPRETVAFAEVPDINSTIDEWRRSDIYQIYLEPAVQEFLKNPIGKTPTPGSPSATIKDLQELDARDAFVALTSTANDQPKIVAGFHFHCRQSVADRVIGSWRSSINPSAQHERLAYQKHDIDLFRQSAFSIAMVEDQNWFFASNDLDQLKAILDRADGRIADSAALLKSDESYREALTAMPASPALLIYFQPKPLIERFATSSPAGPSPVPDQFAPLRKIRSICGTTRFDHGKLHDVIFVGVPKAEKSADLTRSSLPLATTTTIAYAAGVLEFSNQVGGLLSSGNNVLGPAVEKISSGLAAAGITAADWDAAFAPELDLLSDWPAQSRWPSLVLIASVKDGARARKIIDAMMHGGGNDWEQTDRDAVHYWSLAPGSQSGWFSVRPVMALSDRLWITGLDGGSVEATMHRSQKPEPGLAETEEYRRAIALVPAPTKAFTYVDAGRIYSQLDAAIRPLLLMGAAFVPKANESVDLSKVPPAETVTKHLSPIVLSQYYNGKGYVAESVGPVTLNQAGIGLAVLGGMGAMAYQRLVPPAFRPKALPNLGGGVGGSGNAMPAVRAVPTMTVSPATGSPKPSP
jgi:hypothetical protein